jgi:hypothetical protein
MSTKFETPADPSKYSYGGDSNNTPEPTADRVGQFTPEIGAHQDAADLLPSHEDLLSRQTREELSEVEKAQGLQEVEKAKKILGL